MQQVQSSLAQGGGGSPSALNSSTNSEIAASFLSNNEAPTLIASASNPLNNETAPQTGAYSTAQLQSLNALLSSIDPANLPEVSGSNSQTDVAAMVNSAHLLIQQAKALEPLANSQSGLDVSLLAAQAKQYAVGLYMMAILLDIETNQSACNAQAANGTCDIDTPLMQEAGAYLDEYSAEWEKEGAGNLLIKTSFGKYLDVLADRFQKDLLSAEGNDIVIAKTNELFNDFKVTYQPLASTIKELNIQTQQASTVITNGGSINNQPPSAQNGASKTANDANAISACQNATCTPYRK